MTTNSNDVLELSPESNKSTDKRITKKDLKALFWRSFPLNIMWSFDRQMNVGFCYDMIPVIKRLYDKPEDRIEAYKRHLEFYNIRLFGGFCGRDSGIGPAQRAKTTIWN